MIRSFGHAILRWGGWLASRIDAPVVVLAYHRVAELSSDPEQLAVSPDNFRQQMLWLKAHLPVLRFEEDWRRYARPAAVVTFDDGYADNARIALPILEALDLPATFFVTAGVVDSAQEFWWDVLAHCLLERESLPSTLQLPILETPLPTILAEERRVAYARLHGPLRQMDAASRTANLEELRAWAGVNGPARESHRPLSTEELQRLARSPVVTLGAHSVTHPVLSSLSDADLEREIVDSRSRLEEMSGCPVTVFAYPYGGKADFSTTAAQLCRSAGYEKAAANIPGSAHRWHDPYRLPRHLVRNWNEGEFARHMASFVCR
ncbi:MAG: hypothetical protein EG825_02535 [Rhodocyclaceae bacterium]|nr:hypothetical protein [Rhodocyclaceae bacterium]